MPSSLHSFRPKKSSVVSLSTWMFECVCMCVVQVFLFIVRVNELGAQGQIGCFFPVTNQLLIFFLEDRGR
jgi:hypothetical protein